MEESPYFLVTMDKGRSDILGFAMNLAAEDSDFVQLLHSEETEEGVPYTEVFKDMVIELSKKVHDRGWCDDPNCDVE